mmetsp:Transcript_46444/g.133738  ORF Transcript_46444/g.133738 Transcript_46444/m.133738 type:complete len:300 (-) Transcript_46444:172-1071(-)
MPGGAASPGGPGEAPAGSRRRAVPAGGRWSHTGGEGGHHEPRHHDADGPEHPRQRHAEAGARGAAPRRLRRRLRLRLCALVVRQPRKQGLRLRQLRQAGERAGFRRSMAQQPRLLQQRRRPCAQCFRRDGPRLGGQHQKVELQGAEDPESRVEASRRAAGPASPRPPPTDAGSCGRPGGARPCRARERAARSARGLRPHAKHGPRRGEPLGDAVFLRHTAGLVVAAARDLWQRLRMQHPMLRSGPDVYRVAGNLRRLSPLLSLLLARALSGAACRTHAAQAWDDSGAGARATFAGQSAA